MAQLLVSEALAHVLVELSGRGSLDDERSEAATCRILRGLAGQGLHVRCLSVRCDRLGLKLFGNPTVDRLDQQVSRYPLRHHAANVHVVAERGDELNVESYLFVTQIIDRRPSTLSSGLVHWTLASLPRIVRREDMDGANSAA